MQRPRRPCPFRSQVAPSVRPIVLALLMLLAACHSNPFGGSGPVGGSRPEEHPAGADCVHRIVASGQLRVGISGVQPPLNMRNRAGEMIGFDVDLAHALAKAMDLELVLIERAFDELLDGLLASDFDLVISSLTITPERNTRVAFAGPYMISGAALLTRTELLDTLVDPEALNRPDRTWAALDGSTSEDLIRRTFPDARLITTDDLSSFVARIQDGSIDGVIGDLPYVRYELARHPGSGLAVRPSPFTTEPLGIALPPDSPLFANLVQNYLNALEYTGLLIQMKARWLHGGAWLSEMP